MAAEALTAKRRAACWIVLPPSTACTIRSRRSWDKGAVMINSTALAPGTLHRTPDSVQARTALVVGASAVHRSHAAIDWTGAEPNTAITYRRTRVEADPT